MKHHPIRIVLLAVLVMAVTAGAASARYRAGYNTDHYTVEYALTDHWQTTNPASDILKAQCVPWWNHYGNFHRSYGTWFGQAWLCKEWDTVGRRVWVHLHVDRNGHLYDVRGYKCDSTDSAYYCP